MRIGFDNRAFMLPGLLLAGLMATPLVALLMGADRAELWSGMRSPVFLSAVGVSLRSSLVSLGLVVALGLPLAAWLASSRGRWGRLVEALVDLPVVLPPAVLGVALLSAYGREGLLGPALRQVGISLPFTPGAVVMAQVVVSAPFFVQSATAALRRVDPDLVLVARTLGASPARAFVRIALPLAAPGVLAGASLAWARSIGELGATLLFAGSREGVTRTMPLAIFSALESDVRVAVALSLVLAAGSLVALAGLRWFARGTA